MPNELAVIGQDDLEVIQRTARMLAVSGYFDSKGESPVALAQVAVKIMAGRELGFGPFAAVKGIHIISGAPSVSANLMAAAVRSNPSYDYRVREHTDKVCRLEFFIRTDAGKWESLGIEQFTEADAKRAGTKNMDKFPKNMLFARAMSNGVRFFCPDVFSGVAVYTPDELGADVDDNGDVMPQGGGYAIDVTPAPQPAPVAQPEPDDAPAGEVETLITPEILKQLNILGSRLYGDAWDTKRHELVAAITSGATQSSKELTVTEAGKLIAGMERKLKAQPQAA